MAFDWLLGKRESRSSIENPTVSISSENFLSFFGLDGASDTGEEITTDKALSVPGVSASINFLSGTLAGLPLDLYRRDKENRVKVRGGLGVLLHDAPNEEQSSFDWRKSFFDNVFTHGRGISFIERNKIGRVQNIWNLDIEKVSIERKNGRKLYHYQDGDRRVTYHSSEIIDVAFMMKSDGLSAYSPISMNKNIIALALAASRYGSKFFQNGGVPPFAVEGPFQSPGAIQRAADDLTDAVRKASKERKLALALPPGHQIKSIGVDPEKSQLVELQRFLIEQIARIYSLPPTFLQDLTHGTFSNTEQQDLHFVKHTLKRWVEQFEQELNLKLFGRGNSGRFVEMNVDSLLRGDIKTRYEAYASGVQNGLLTPNEVRRKENLPDDKNGGSLMIQGATVPIEQQFVLPLQESSNE